jgi:hypothetical protein
MWSAMQKDVEQNEKSVCSRDENCLETDLQKENFEHLNNAMCFSNEFKQEDIERSCV